MKKLILPVFFSFQAFTLAAQETKAPVTKACNQELGIFGQEEANNDNQSIGMVGLQYKRWHSEHLGFRVIAAFAQYTSWGSHIQYVSGDTSVTKQEQINISLPVIGFGVEAQRHFYKRVYLFAAAELKGGYGNGIGDTSVSISASHGATSWYVGQNVGRRDASLLYVGLTASIGAKIQWSRVCLGLELFPVQMAYTRIDDGNNRGGITDLSLNNFSERLFLHWRF